jgi:hypothetical protein
MDGDGLDLVSVVAGVALAAAGWTGLTAVALDAVGCGSDLGASIFCGCAIFTGAGCAGILERTATGGAAGSGDGLIILL